jgi:uroporphyrinogen decarboxylase
LLIKAGLIHIIQGRTFVLPSQASFIRQETDKALMAKLPTPICEQACYMRGLEQWMEDLIANPQIVWAILDRVCDVAIGLADVGLDSIGEYIDGLRLSGDDLGTHTGPLISLQMYEKFINPPVFR